MTTRATVDTLIDILEDLKTTYKWEHETLPKGLSYNWAQHERTMYKILEGIDDEETIEGSFKNIDYGWERLRGGKALFDR